MHSKLMRYFLLNTPRWTIKARVIRKGTVKQTGKGDPLIEIILKDSTGTIKATIFSNLFETIANRIEEGAIYQITSCTVSSRYGAKTKILSHSCELKFRGNSTVTKNAIPKTPLNYNYY